MVRSLLTFIRRQIIGLMPTNTIFSWYITGVEVSDMGSSYTISPTFFRSPSYVLPDEALVDVPNRILS